MQSSSKVLEHNGKMIITTEKLPYEQLWFIAKNTCQEHVYQMSDIYQAKNTTHCTYSDDIETMTAELEKKVHISVPSSETI